MHFRHQGLFVFAFGQEGQQFGPVKYLMMKKYQCLLQVIEMEFVFGLAESKERKVWKADLDLDRLQGQLAVYYFILKVTGDCFDQLILQAIVLYFSLLRGIKLSRQIKILALNQEIFEDFKVVKKKNYDLKQFVLYYWKNQMMSYGWLHLMSHLMHLCYFLSLLYQFCQLYHFHFLLSYCCYLSLSLNFMMRIHLNQYLEQVLQWWWYWWHLEMWVQYFQKLFDTLQDNFYCFRNEQFHILSQECMLI